MEKSAEIPARGTDFSSLDLLRSASALAVVVSHCLGLWGHAGPVVGRLAQIAVLFFFVHTSFVLMLSLERQLLASPEHLWRRFMIRRLFRIYPLTTIVLTAILIFHIPSRMTPPSFEFVHETIPGIISNYLLTMNLTVSRPLLSPLWSLPYEMQMYVVLPALFSIASRWKSAMPALGTWLAAVVLAVLQPLIPKTGRLDLCQFAPCFVAGILGYKFSKIARPLLPFALWPALLAAFFGLYLLSPGDAGYAWATCLLTAITLPFLQETSWPVLRAVCHWIAQRSYGIYLTHSFCLWLAFRANRFPLLLQWTIFISVLAALPSLLYHTVELPLIRVGRSLSEPRPRQPSGQDVTAAEH